MTGIRLSTPTGPSVLDYSLFRDLPAEVADVLLRDSAILHVQARDMLFREGDTAGEYMYVQQGSIEVLRTTQDGQERVFQIFEPRRLLAETAMFMTHGRYPMSARVRTDAIVQCLKGEGLLAACRMYPELGVRLLRRLSDRVYERVNDVEWYSDSSAAQRLASYLLGLQARMGASSLRLPLTQRQLAAHLGVRAETLSRLLADWSAQGRVTGQRRDWEICDEAFLRGLIEPARREF
ncbi:MAG: Crp/Fnr family transcriptional regulator [Alcaligenaceae bacterium]|nr:Crp/Fnr family transcriptional regulator [Alcaligenaceae bacterium]